MIVDAKLVITGSEFEQRIADELKFDLTRLINERINQFIMNDDECWKAIQGHVHSLIKTLLVDAAMEDIRMEFANLSLRMMSQERLGLMENKLESLSRNMDALYLKITERDNS